MTPESFFDTRSQPYWNDLKEIECLFYAFGGDRMILGTITQCELSIQLRIFEFVIMHAEGDLMLKSLSFTSNIFLD